MISSLKCFFDQLISVLALFFLSPILACIAILIKMDSNGPVIFRQTRVGRYGVPFELYKFRTMFMEGDKKRQITVGDRDPRITKVGYYLRKYKLDELPQLWNIVKSDMSIVGPRPEVPQYVDLYDDRQRQVLWVRPGLTDYASLEYFEEAKLLAQSADPEKTYIEEILPAKLELNLKYLEERNFLVDLKIIFRTIFRIIGLD
ncbi:MAG: sugar transferase [Saprospiraceae bacterium]|nr:sugar transferase [Saprospiraceae bacterium]